VAPATGELLPLFERSPSFAAATLIAWDGRRWAPLWLTVAAIVGTSRAYVRIHHPSDVVGGAVIGLALASLLRRAILRFAPR